VTAIRKRKGLKEQIPTPSDYLAWTSPLFFSPVEWHPVSWEYISSPVSAGFR